jgi:hypothetical protein
MTTVSSEPRDKNKTNHKIECVFSNSFRLPITRRPKEATIDIPGVGVGSDRTKPVGTRFEL